MRKLFLPMSFAGLALSAADAAAAALRVSPSIVGPGPRAYARGRDSIIPAGINRRTGHPHEHKREIARRRRQMDARSSKIGATQ